MEGVVLRQARNQTLRKRVFQVSDTRWGGVRSAGGWRWVWSTSLWRRLGSWWGCVFVGEKGGGIVGRWDSQSDWDRDWCWSWNDHLTDLLSRSSVAVETRRPAVARYQARMHRREPRWSSPHRIARERFRTAGR